MIFQTILLIFVSEQGANRILFDISKNLSLSCLSQLNQSTQKSMAELNFNLNQTVIRAEKVTIISQSNSFIRIGFPSKVSNGRPVAGCMREAERTH
jgi:thiamine pyrophosphokinase